MAQGRITLSGKAGGRYDFISSKEMPAARPSGMTETIVSGLMPELADQWLMESIERRRALIQQVTDLHRNRIARFVEQLFDEESDECDTMVDAMIAECGDPQKVVERLFDPAARIIGDNWCADECDFVKVTIAMSRIQRLFRRLTAEHPPVAAPDMTRCALLTPAPGEQHMFGLCVVEDAFRRGGWEVDCCDCDEAANMFRLVASNSYRIIGVSVSADRHLPDLVSIVRKLRSKSRNKSVVLMAGGSLVMQNPQGAVNAGFDLLAVDASSAVALAEAVVTSKTIANERLAAE